MNGNYLNKILQLNAKHALYRDDGEWYHNLSKFPGILFDKNGYIRFDTEKDYLSNNKLQRKKDLHIKDGIKSLIQYRNFTAFEIALINAGTINLGTVDTTGVGPEDTVRILRTVDVILRKKHLVKKIKELYANTCQICGEKLQIGPNQFYSEVHHIVPLGNPHNGADRMGNMMCVCPNHHVLLDLKAIRLNTSDLILLKHNIEEDCISHHNTLCVN